MKKILVIITAIAMSLPMTTNVFAASSKNNLKSLWESRENFELISLSDEQVVSNFDANNVTYQVEEYIDIDTHKIISKFYILENEKIYLGEQETNFKQNDTNIYIEISENNEVVDQQTMNIETYNNSNKSNDTSTGEVFDPLDEIIVTPNILPPADGGGSYVESKWVSQGVYNGSNTIAQYSVGALTILIGYISGGATGTVVAYIVDRAIQENWDRVYYSKETFVYLERCSTWPSYPNWIQAGGYKYITKFYSDSARKDYIRTTTVTDQ